MPSPNIVIKSFGGQCPIQAEGTINGKHFYLRGRGETMYFYVFEEEMFNWKGGYRYSSVTHPGTAYGAGWAKDEEVEAFFQEAIADYCREKLSS